MMLHRAEVHQTHAHTLAQLHYHRCRERTTAPVDRMPVPIHERSVGNGGIGWNEEVLVDQRKVSINGRVVGYFGMNDEKPAHAHRFLHCHMRMVEKRTGLMQIEFILECGARLDQVLHQSRNTIHFDRQLEAVPMHGSRLWKLVVNEDSHPVALVRLNRRTGEGSVIAPHIHKITGQKLAFDRLSAKMKFPDPADLFAW